MSGTTLRIGDEAAAKLGLVTFRFRFRFPFVQALLSAEKLTDGGRSATFGEWASGWGFKRLGPDDLIKCTSTIVEPSWQLFVSVL